MIKIDERPAGRPVIGAVRRRPQRADIQGLRALAVGLVLIYHLRPNRLSGGFVGVDVFFVISGFLIIGTLVAEIQRTGRLTLAAFYARRIRRLLPAASLTLLVTAAGTVALLPAPLWPPILQQVVASSVDVQNWVLAIFSADYAHATAAASPVQHFWSLSVEEQFYLVIPIILLLSALAAKRFGHPLRWAFGAVAVISAASLAYSILTTNAPPQGAYFVTPTRMWELGFGGLAAMAVPRLRLPLAARLVLGWVGLGVVAFSALTFTTSMAFPGWIALAPTLGAVALLVAGSRHANQPPAPVEISTLLGLQPFRYLGDISYSLYLWHWPVIVFVLERTGGSALTTPEVYKVTALSLLLAAASKHFVEDPFRHRRAATPERAKRRLRGTYLLGATLVVITLVAASVPWVIAQRKIDTLLTASSTLDESHPGALAFDPVNPVAAPEGVPLVPDPAVAAGDKAPSFSNECAIYDPVKYPLDGDECAYGDLSATKTMVLVGDSHMNMYSTAMIDFANIHRGWRIKLVVHDGCAFGDLPPNAAGYPLPVCAQAAHQLLPLLLKLKPAMVVAAGYTLTSSVVNGQRVWSKYDQAVAGYREFLQPLTAAGIKVGIVRDIPQMAKDTPTCLLQNPDDISACDTSQAAALGDTQDPLVTASAGLPNVTVADLTGYLCKAGVCPAVVGNVVVYRDNHLTDTFVRTLTIPLAKGLGLISG
jgi:peptidoglycan/LPS O-acetylase OafA/YrhL